MSYFLGLAFLGGSVGAGEWVVLGVVVLIVVGPKRLPEIARKTGRMMEMFRRAADEFKDQLLNMDQEPSKGGGGAPAAKGASESAPPGEEDTTEGYGNPNPYPDVADYPGNEAYAENGASGEDGGTADSGSGTPPEHAP